MTDIHPGRCQMRRWLLSLLLLTVSVVTHAETWVITNQAHPVSAPSGTRIILLDDQQRLEEQLSNQLPADPRQAETAIQRYLASPEGRRLQNDLAQAQQGVTDAWSLGVEKLPAVVVDRRHVVYGEPEVAKAVELIERARSLSR